MSTFESELKKSLHRNLPQSQENVWSKRVEGALVKSEETVPHEYVTIIVDSSINKDDYVVISERIYKIIKHDAFYRWSKYRVILWNNNEFTMISKPKIQVSHVKDCLKELDLGNGNNGTWETFWELYRPHKKAGRVIMLTTSKAIESLRESNTKGIKNLIITYCGNSESKLVQKISEITCIAYVEQKGELTLDDFEEK